MDIDKSLTLLFLKVFGSIEICKHMERGIKKMRVKPLILQTHAYAHTQPSWTEDSGKWHFWATGEALMLIKTFTEHTTQSDNPELPPY